MEQPNPNIPFNIFEFLVYPIIQAMIIPPDIKMEIKSKSFKLLKQLSETQQHFLQKTQMQ